MKHRRIDAPTMSCCEADCLARVAQAAFLAGFNDVAIWLGRIVPVRAVLLRFAAARQQGLG